MARASKGTDFGAAAGLDLKATCTRIYCVMFCQVSGLVHPQSKTRYSFMLLSRERQLCVNFLPKEIMSVLVREPTISMSRMFSFLDTTHTHTHTHTHNYSQVANFFLFILHIKGTLHCLVIRPCKLDCIATQLR